MQACRIYKSTSNTSYAIQLQQVLSEAATEAEAAARLDGRWDQLATDMMQIAGLPETGNTPAQEVEYTHDNEEVVATCSAISGSS